MHAIFKLDYTTFLLKSLPLKIPDQLSPIFPNFCLFAPNSNFYTYISLMK